MAAYTDAPERIGDRGRWRGLTTAGPLTYVAAIFVVAVTIIPLLFVIEGGFRSNAQINSAPVGLPHPWVWSNYSTILSSSAFWEFIWNSVRIAVVATATAVAVGSMAAFALSRYAFRGRDALYAFFTIGLLFPIGVAAIPLYLVLHQLNWLEHWYGVAVPEAAFSLPVTIVILRPFMRAIPGEIEDAAVLDGSSRLGFFWKILLPLSAPALTTVAVLAFVTSWNAYLLPLVVFSQTNDFTLPLGVAMFQTQYSQDTASVLAFTALSMVPALGFLLVAERWIVGGLTGAVKG